MWEKLSSIAVAFLIILGTFCLFLLETNVIKFNNNYKISIKNNTNKFIENLELQYNTGELIETITEIDAKTSWKDKINTNTINGENSIVLTYKDNNNNLHKEIVVSFLEKGSSGRANIIIDSIDENGKLNLITQ